MGQNNFYRKARRFYARLLQNRLLEAIRNDGQLSEIWQMRDQITGLVRETPKPFASTTFNVTPEPPRYLSRR